MSGGPLRVGCIGMGWWSDVLADAIQRSGKLEIVSCYTRSEEKRQAFAAKYRCRPVASYEAMLADPRIEAIINTTPNDVHLATTSAAAAAGKHVFLDKPIANTIADGRAITEACRKAGVVLALGYQRRRESQFRWIRRQIDDGRFGKLVNAEANISRDRLGKIDLTSWRYQAAGMPGGVMLQIGIHYIDVLEYLIGPIRAVRGQAAQLVLPGDNPDVASLILEHNERRAVDAERQLRLGIRVLSDEHLRQGRHRLLRFAQRAPPSQARRKRAHGDQVAPRTTPWSKRSRSLPPRRAERASTKSAASTRRDRLRWCAPAFSRRGRDAGSRSRRSWAEIVDRERNACSGRGSAS